MNNHRAQDIEMYWALRSTLPLQYIRSRYGILKLQVVERYPEACLLGIENAAIFSGCSRISVSKGNLITATPCCSVLDIHNFAGHKLLYFE